MPSYLKKKNSKLYIKCHLEKYIWGGGETYFEYSRVVAILSTCTKIFVSNTLPYLFSKPKLRGGGGGDEWKNIKKALANILPLFSFRFGKSPKDFSIIIMIWL